jgi:hypothetical protein
MSKVVKFRNYSCRVTVSRYYYGNTPCIHLISTIDGSPVATATVNLIDYGLLPPKNCCHIKNYSENQGILEALIEAEIIKPLDQVIKFGPYNCEAHLCEISADLLSQLPR